VIYSISPSKLELFRKHYERKPDDTFWTEEKVIEYMSQPFEWSDDMIRGSGFHAMLEHGIGKYYVAEQSGYVVNDGEMPKDWFFTPEEARVAFVWRDKYPGTTFEIPIKYSIPFEDYTVILNMRLDGLWGEILMEQKTTGKTRNQGFYEPSIQWRIYLLVTQSPFVQYNVFQFKENKLQGTKIVIPHEYQFWKYPQMETDVHNLVREFVHFCKVRGLDQYILPKYNATPFVETAQRGMVVL